MDTPDRNRIGTPLSKFEDSPVFNYINNLSPIKPVKSVHITQTFQSLSFVTSIPSVFTSPHVGSLKESRFHRRLQSPDLSRPEFSPDNGDVSKTSLGGSDAIPLPSSSTDLQERCDIGTSVEEFNVDPFHKRLKLAIKPPRILQYDGGSPKGDATASYSGIKTDLEMEMSVAPASLLQLVQEGLQEMTKHVQQDEAEMPGRCQDEQSKEEVSGYDWENLISDAADQVLVFQSATDQLEAFRRADKKLVDHDDNNFASHSSNFPCDETEDLSKAQSVGAFPSSYQLCLQDPEVHSEEAEQQNETDHTPQLLPSSFQNKEETGDLGNRSGEYIPFGLKDEIQQQRGMRRRCLVFEMTGTKKRPLGNDSKSSSSNSVQSEGRFPSGNKQLAPLNPRTGSCMLPSIGLHLNALATTSKDCRIVKHETSTSGSQLISMPNAASSLSSVAAGQKLLNNSSSIKSVESDSSLVGDEVQVTEGAQQPPAFEVGEEFNQISPKKKRCRLENAGESEGCKRCNCKKSKCLKLYCECFVPMACPTSILHSFPLNPPNPRKFISCSSLPTSHLKASFRDRAFHTSHFKCFARRLDKTSSSSPKADEGPSKEVIVSGKKTVGPTDLLEQYPLVRYYLKLRTGVRKAVDGVKKAMKWIGGVPLLLFMLHVHVDGFYM